LNTDKERERDIKSIKTVIRVCFVVFFLLEQDVDDFAESESESRLSGTIDYCTKHTKQNVTSF
jgi:hypothetical protein